MRIFAIDPGNTESAYVLMDSSNMVPMAFGKVPNAELLKEINTTAYRQSARVVIEMVASYGMAVGQEVFDTCVWIGRFSQMAIINSLSVDYVFRKVVKRNLCGVDRAKDPNVRQALIDRFAQHDRKNGKGTKADPDWFYGFSKDVWAAYAVAVTYADNLEV